MSISDHQSSNNRPDRSIRSFIIREGRFTRGQRQAMNTLFPIYGLNSKNYHSASLDANIVFNSQGRLVMEIGFGDGEALLEMAENNPDTRFIGIEVYRPGVGRLLREMHKRQLKNIRVFCEDAMEVLVSSIADHSLDKLCLYFPDPWPKKKHNKRRILQDDFLCQVVRVLKIGGIFHFASDWQPYAEQALEKLDNISLLKNLAGKHHYSDRPKDRPMTKFENRGLKRGHGVWDILMEKQNNVERSEYSR